MTGDTWTLVWVRTGKGEGLTMMEGSKDWSDQRARREMWEDLFHRRCATKQDVINSAVVALVLREAEVADLRERVQDLDRMVARKNCGRDLTPQPDASLHDV